MFVATLPANALLLLAAAAIVGLGVLIAKIKCNAVVALTLMSLLLGLAAGMEPLKVADAFKEGVATTMGGLAMIIGLGTILGKLLAESGAAQVIADRFTRLFGRDRLDYAIMIAAFVVGVSVFFQVGIILLGPITFALARESRTPILRLALPLAAGMSTAHGLIPPHPGPLAAINLIGADIGKTIAWSLLVVGPPVALITGPLLARWVTPRVPVEIGGLGAKAISEPSAPSRPGFGISLFTMLSPVLLMLISTVAVIVWPATAFPAGTFEGEARRWAEFVGNPTVAMLAAVLLAFWTFGGRVGLSANSIQKFADECLAPTAGILLVIAAGGGFSKVLNYSGIADALAIFGKGLNLSPLLLAWIIAGMLRVAVGSATVAITAAAGIVLPLVKADPTINKELLVLSMGAGSLILSHVNDSGFWFVKEYLGMTVAETLKTWTVVETGIAVVSIVIILAANAVIS
jgi:GntP family gluconate:H+ symporter